MRPILVALNISLRSTDMEGACFNIFKGNTLNYYFINEGKWEKARSTIMTISPKHYITKHVLEII